jgi:tetratricopeptide (TPR) repeat protein
VEEAMSLFRRAQEAYDASDFWNAIQFCHQAIDQAPERAEAYHLLGLALSKNPKWRQDAEKNLRIATNLDPWKADYFLALGSLYQDVGLHLRARKAFEQAKAVDPTAKVPDD